ncbi:type III pantothenate kinase [candidate division WOR-3 bacterium]|nr:type III pantothenate kinase [candidate division WOR-3 bacterium]
MVVVLDIGNTNIHLGLYNGEKLVKKAICPLTEKFSKDKILNVLKNKRMDGVAIASVVPRFTSKFSKFFKERFNISPLIISPNMDCHLKFGYRKPGTLGTDRIAGVVGGLARYKRNLIIVDFGTATTLDIILKDGYYLGGIIFPGIGTLMDALVERTSLLKKVSLKKPAHIIGTSTEECIQSGIFNGAVAMVSGLIRMIRKEYRKKFLCVATGGWGKIMSSQIEEIKYFDPDLCLFGILKIYYYNA